MSNATVLVVDDDHLIREGVARALARAGFAVETAASGEDALVLATARDFDVAVCDYRLPGMDGVSLLQSLREQQFACVRILMTGMLDVATAVSAVNTAAITQALQKPVNPRDLVQAVNDALAARDRILESKSAAERKLERQAHAQLLELFDGDHVRLALQPIVTADGGAVFGYEGLLRSTHPVLSGPATVLPAVEAGGLVQQLADTVAQRATAWFGRMPSETTLFLNMHPLELGDRERLLGRLGRLAPWAGRVVLEITERSTLDDVDGWERSVDAITGAGFAIAVDDIGAGYSSLSVMADLQPKFIKIDMSIVRNVHDKPHKRRLVDLLCTFAEATGATVVGEGVEYPEEAEALRQSGVHLLQGYLFGKPSLEPFTASRAA